MNRRSGNRITHFFLGLSALIMAASLLGGAALIFSDDGGGFLSGLGKALGLVLIAAGNLLSWGLNLVSWYRTRMGWLGIVLGIQSLPAIFFAGWLGIMGVEDFLERRASNQRTNVYNAIKADDVPALQTALPKCGERCQEFFSVQRTLMVASLHGSHQAARYLLDYGTSHLKHADGASIFYNARTSLYTCEGSYLASLGALDLAVANHDMEMLGLLWSTSDDRARLEALWIAAKLDRLDMVQVMTGLHSTPDARPTPNPKTFQPDASTLQPLTRKSYRGEHETLLRAAASGAALEVGQWLLQTRPIALPATEIQLALTDLLAFALDTSTPRSVAFARLLLQHGADIQSATIQNKPALESAITYRSNAMASLLLELGADPVSLSEHDAEQLNTLLLQPDRPRRYRHNTQGCVAH